MKKSLVILCGLVVFAYAAYAMYAKAQPTFEIYGAGALTTTASQDDVCGARYEVCHSLGHWIHGEDGKISNPSFGETGQSWSSTTDSYGKSRTRGVGRGKTQFTDAKGSLIVIEEITGDGLPTYVFFTASGDDGSAPVLNAFIASLQKRGVKMAGH